MGQPADAGVGKLGPQFHLLEKTLATLPSWAVPRMVLCQRACCVRGSSGAGGGRPERSFRCGWTGGQGWWCERPRPGKWQAGGTVLLRLQPSPSPA